MMAWYASELEKKHALSLLWFVKNNPGMTKTDIVRMEKGGEKTKYGVLSGLIELGLIAQERDPDGRWNSEHLALTENGTKIAEYIEAINLIMEDIYSTKTDKLGDMRVGTAGAYVIRIRITLQLRGMKTL